MGKIDPFFLLSLIPGTFNLTTIDGQTLQTTTAPYVPPPPSGGGLNPQPLALQGVQIIDPQNATGKATPTGSNTATVTDYTGTSRTGPVWSTYRDLTNAWGTTSPLFTITTILVFASSHIDDTDPVVFTPYQRDAEAYSPVIVGVLPTVIRSYELSGHVAKNTAAGSNNLLQFDLNAATVSSTRLINTTRGRSEAWSYALAGDPPFWNLSQPFEPPTIPVAYVPSENDIWLNDQSVDECQAVQVNLVSLGFVPLDGSGALQIVGLDAWDPAGGGTSALQINAFLGLVVFQSVKFDKYAANFDGFSNTNYFNCCFAYGSTSIGYPYFFGGMVDPATCMSWTIYAQSSYYPPVLDFDFVLGATTGLCSVSGYTFWGQMALDTPFLYVATGEVYCGGSQLAVDAPSCIYSCGNSSNGPSVTFDLEGFSSLIIASEFANAANTLTFPQAQSGASMGLLLNGEYEPYTVTANYAINPSLETTPCYAQNLDACLEPQQGFFRWGGATFRYSPL